MWQKVVAVLLTSSTLISASPAVVMNDGKQVVRRQVLGAPLHSPCGPSIGCAAPGYCQASMCMPAALPPPPPPVYAPPMPAPIPVAAPAYAPPPPPLPMPPPACAPPCAPGGCLGGCGCPGFAPGLGCAPPLPPPAPAYPVPALAPPPPPAPAGRLIPQALPGAPCEPGVECTGGSVCSMGICLCPPELVQEGTVCVSRTLYGPVAPAPPPPPVAYPVPVRPSFIDPCGGIHKRSVEKGADCHN